MLARKRITPQVRGDLTVEDWCFSRLTLKLLKYLPFVNPQFNILIILYSSNQIKLGKKWQYFGMDTCTPCVATSSSCKQQSRCCSVKCLRSLVCCFLSCISPSILISRIPTRKRITTPKSCFPLKIYRTRIRRQL